MDRDEFRRTSLESWKRMASGWERRRASIDESAAPVREWLVRELAPQPGETILELAAGPGDTGFSAAARLGDEGNLISSDFSPEMLEVARRRGAELGLDNVEFRVLDAERIDLPDDSVDGVICRFGFMLTADPAAALRETRRVLRPGGRLVLAVWRGPERNPWVSVAGRVLVEGGHAAPPDPEAPSMFGLASDERLRQLLDTAGFTEMRLEDVPVVLAPRSIADYIATARDTGGAFARAYDEASAEARNTITREIAEAFAPFEVDGGYELPGVALAAVAR